MKIKRLLSCILSAMLLGTTLPVKALETGWNQVGNEWVYVKEDGSKMTGWMKEGNCWYYFKENGTMYTGWLANAEHWYYMGISGVMQTSTTVVENGVQYYLKSTGIMARNFYHEGYEYDNDGVGSPLSDDSIVYDGSKLPEEVKGNLYITDEYPEVELEGITVNGAIVLQSELEIPMTVTLKDSTVKNVSLQARNSEVIFLNDTEVEKVVIEEVATVTAGKGYDGTVNTVEVQSSATTETVLNVAAEEVNIRSYGTVVLNDGVTTVNVGANTNLEVNADVDTIIVASNATESVITVSKGNTVGTVEANATVALEGKGTITTLEANVDGVTDSDEIKIKEVEKAAGVTEAPEESKGTSGGSISGGTSGGTNTPTTPSEPEVVTTTEVDTEEELIAALENENLIQITIVGDIDLLKDIVIPEGVTLTINEGKTLTAKGISVINYGTLENNGSLQFEENTETAQAQTFNIFMKVSADEGKEQFKNYGQTHHRGNIHFPSLESIGHTGTKDIYLFENSCVYVGKKLFVGRQGNELGIMELVGSSGDKKTPVATFGLTGDGLRPMISFPETSEILFWSFDLSNYEGVIDGMIISTYAEKMYVEESAMTSFDTDVYLNVDGYCNLYLVDAAVENGHKVTVDLKKQLLGKNTGELVPALETDQATLGNETHELSISSYAGNPYLITFDGKYILNNDYFIYICDSERGASPIVQVSDSFEGNVLLISEINNQGSFKEYYSAKAGKTYYGKPVRPESAWVDNPDDLTTYTFTGRNITPLIKALENTSYTKVVIDTDITIEQDIEVPAGKTLIINSGRTVTMKNSKFKGEGTVINNGTIADPTKADVVDEETLLDALKNEEVEMITLQAEESNNSTITLNTNATIPSGKTLIIPED